jgi:hypothetical protein
MKKTLLISFLMISTMWNLNAQEPDKSRRDRRVERQELRMKEVAQMIRDKTFLFEATHALPLGGGSIYLNYSFDVELKRDTLASYLPFYGVAYRVDYGSRNSGLDFVQPVQSYDMEEKEDEYLIIIEVKNKMDLLSYTFFISRLGYATLNVTSTNRQAISYYGRLETPETE